MAICLLLFCKGTITGLSVTQNGCNWFKAEEGSTHSVKSEVFTYPINCFPSALFCNHCLWKSIQSKHCLLKSLGAFNTVCGSFFCFLISASIFDPAPVKVFGCVYPQISFVIGLKTQNHDKTIATFSYSGMTPHTPRPFFSPHTMLWRLDWLWETHFNQDISRKDFVVL